MFDTMTMTKIVGGFCGSLLVFMLGNWVAESLYHTGGGHGKEEHAAYVIDTGDPRVGKRFNRVDRIKCPVCEADMLEELDDDQPHIMYERCPEGHGTFLDAGEFTDLVHKTFWDRFKRAR